LGWVGGGWVVGGKEGRGVDTIKHEP
jgi:hypothetical protein